MEGLDKKRHLTPEERKLLRHQQEQRRQAQEAGCFGLLDGGAFSVTLKRDISADDAAHTDAPFICRGCLSDAVLRKCIEKRDHYAHHARTSPAIPPGETDLHQACLDEILHTLQDRFPNGKWAKNREIPASADKDLGKVVPDVSGRLGGPEGQRLVIEAQVSFLSLPEIIKRSQVYAKRDIPILWILPLVDDLGDDPFRPRLYERYLHAMYFGRVYYWRPGFATQVLPVHYGVVERRIPVSEWFDAESREECQAGGYDKVYKVIKRPLAGSMVDMVSQFYACSRPEFRPWNERKAVPALKIWRDKLADWWDKSAEDTFHKTYTEENYPKERHGQRKDRLSPPYYWRFHH